MDDETESCLVEMLTRKGIKDPNEARFLISAIGLCAMGLAFAQRRGGDIFFAHSQNIEDAKVH